MAETLSSEEKFFKSVATVKFKDRPVFKGTVDHLRNLGYEIATLVSAPSDRKNLRLFAEKESLLRTLDDDLSSLEIFENMTWDTLSNAQQNAVLTLVRDINTLSEANFGTDQISSEVMETLDQCKEVLGKVGEQLKNIASLQSFTNGNLKDLLKQVDDGNISYYTSGNKILVPSKDDLDIVTALKMTGIDLQFENNQWKLNTNPVERDVSFVPLKDGQPLQVFGNENIQFLLNNYLNVPHEQRQQTVSASKLLKVYVNEYERQMTEGKQLSGLEQGIIRQDIARQRNIFAVNSNEFQITKLLDRDTMVRNAQKMGFVGAFKAIVAKAKDTNEITKDAQGIVDEISDNPAFKGVSKGLSHMIDILEKAGDKYEDLAFFEGDYVDDYIQDYDRQIEYLIRTNADSDKIEAVQIAKAEFVENVAFQNAYWRQKLPQLAMANGGNIFTKDLAELLNETMEFAIKQKDGEFVMANGEAVQQFMQRNKLWGNLYNQLRQDILNKNNGNTQQDNTQKPQVLEGYPDIFFDYAVLVEGVDLSSDSNIVTDYSNFKLFEEMWREGQFFDVNFKLYKETTKNPNATVEEYIENFANAQEEPPMFNPDVVLDAYYSVHKDKANEQNLNKAQARVDRFNKYLLISDLMLKSFTPDEIAQYDGMVDAVKTPFLNKKYQEALKELAKLEKDPVNFEKALNNAIKRHEPSVVGSVIGQKWSQVADAEKQSGVGSLLSSAVDSFLNECERNKQKNNQELAQAGEPVLKDGEQENEKEDNPVLFDDLFPSGPNVVKFQKAMKPYSAKSIMKFFIDPLLGDLGKTKIYPKKSNNANAFVPSQRVGQDVEEDTKENNSNEKIDIAEEIQKQESQIIAVKQRDFEASAFVPATLMFEIVRQKSKGNPEYEQADKLKHCFKYMASTDDLQEDSKLGIVAPNGRDVRDELRGLALRICAGDFKSSKDVENTLAPILTKYGVDQQLQEDIKDAFMFMTPELLAIALEPVSIIKGNTMQIGAKLPDSVINSKSDNDRMLNAQIKEEFNGNNHNGTIENLSALIGTIYRTKDSSEIDIADIDRGFSVKLDHESAIFSQVKDNEQVKAMLNKLRNQAGMIQGQPAPENTGEEPTM